MLLQFFKKLLKNRNTEQCIGCYCYPDRILLMTQNKTTAGFWIVTNNAEFLPVNCTNEQLGNKILEQLSLSKTEYSNPTKEGFKALAPLFKKATGMSCRQSMQDSKYVNVYRIDKRLEFSPTINNGPNSGFQYQPELFFGVEDDFVPENLGQYLRDGWNNSL